MTPGSPRPSLTSVTHIPSPPAFGSGQEDTRGNTPFTACDSPGGQTLAALKQEAIKDKQVTQQTINHKVQNPSSQANSLRPDNAGGIL